MNLRRIPVLIWSAVVGVALAAGAQAQPVQEEQVTTAFTGQVVRVDADAKTITVRGANGESGVFAIVEKTTIMSGSQEIGLSALHEGAQVVLDADRRGDRQIATYLEVVDDPSMAKNPCGEKTPPVGAAAGATLEVGHNRLEPALVQIGAGQSVTFHNVDKMPGGHTVVADDKSFSSPALGENQSWSHSFDVPGVYEVHLKEHPDAKASIVVE